MLRSSARIVRGAWSSSSSASCAVHESLKDCRQHRPLSSPFAHYRAIYYNNSYFCTSTADADTYSVGSGSTCSSTSVSVNSEQVFENENGSIGASSSNSVRRYGASLAAQVLRRKRLGRRRRNLVLERQEDGQTTGMDSAYSAIELALDSVVKIFTVSSSPNYFLPWQNKSQRESMGSGSFLFLFLNFMFGSFLGKHERKSMSSKTGLFLAVQCLQLQWIANVITYINVIKL